jgi:hypothetical protein
MTSDKQSARFNKDLNETTLNSNLKGDHKVNTDRIRFLVIHSMFAIAVLGLLLGVSARKSLAQGLSGAVLHAHR